VRSRRPAAAAVFVGLVAGLGLGARSQRPDTSAKAVTNAAAAYVAGYEERFAFLLADERYEQQVVDDAGHVTARRIMTGESFLTFVSADHAWVSVHDIAEVDGVPADDRQDVRALLEKEPFAGVARLLSEHNARYNLGRITRNFNEPTLGLQVLDPKYRPQFKFDRSRVRLQDDATVVTLTFKEVDWPTLVRGADGSPIYSTGAFDVDAGTGRIRHTSLHLKYGTITADLDTTFSLDEVLDMWVPTRFSERYEQTDAKLREVVACEATYTNYRRFSARGRIK
jgi:hypothetical protein